MFLASVTVEFGLEMFSSKSFLCDHRSELEISERIYSSPGSSAQSWASAVHDKELGSAWKSIWFPSWRPGGSAQTDIYIQQLWGDLFKKGEFSFITSVIAYETFRGEEMNHIKQYDQDEFGDSDVKELLIRKGELWSFMKNNEWRAPLKRVQTGQVTNDESESGLKSVKYHSSLWKVSVPPLLPWRK